MIEALSARDSNWAVRQDLRPTQHTAAQKPGKAVRGHTIPVGKPAEHGRNEGIAEEIDKEVRVLSLSLKEILRIGPHHWHQNLPEIILEGVLPLYRQRIVIERPVFIEILTQIPNQCPGALIGAALHRRKELSLENPVDQVILVSKVIVKALPVHLAHLTDIADTDF